MPIKSRMPGTRNALYWIGWGMSGLAIAFFLMDATMKLLALPTVLQANAALGFEGGSMARQLGVILLSCTTLYAAPRSAVLGAILLTGYLGGAVAAHFRVGDLLLTQYPFGSLWRCSRLGRHLLAGRQAARDPSVTIMRGQYSAARATAGRDSRSRPLTSAVQILRV